MTHHRLSYLRRPAGFYIRAALGITPDTGSTT